MHANRLLALSLLSQTNPRLASFVFRQRRSVAISMWLSYGIPPLNQGQHQSMCKTVALRRACIRLKKKTTCFWSAKELPSTGPDTFDPKYPSRRSSAASNGRQTSWRCWSTRKIGSSRRGVAEITNTHTIYHYEVLNVLGK